MDCRAPVKLERMTRDLAQMLSAIEQRRGNRPITTGDVARCEPCGEIWRAEQTRLSEGLQRDTEAVFNGLIELRRDIVAGDKPEGMWEDAIRSIPDVIRLGHPDAFARSRSDPPRCKRKGGGKTW